MPRHNHHYEKSLSNIDSDVAGRCRWRWWRRSWQPQMSPLLNCCNNYNTSVALNLISPFWARQMEYLEKMSDMKFVTNVSFYVKGHQTLMFINLVVRVLRLICLSVIHHPRTVSYSHRKLEIHYWCDKITQH